MKSPRCFAIACLVFVLSQTGLVWAAESSAKNSVTPSIRLESNTGLLTLETHDAPLHEVLHKIGELAGFKTIQVANSNQYPRITVFFENRPVLEIVEHLVDKANRIVFFTVTEDEPQQRVISQVWLLGTGQVSNHQTSGPTENSVTFSDDLEDDDGKLRSEAVLRLSQQVAVGISKSQDKGALLAKIGRMLREDQNPLVRSRAAIALGAMRDERAVVDLESALWDENASVRSQSISALGQIDGERATLALGTILLNGSIRSLERVMAARALWKHDSEIAREYLRIATRDEVKQVRLAASKPPSLTKGTGSQQLGPEETQ